MAFLGTVPIAFVGRGPAFVFGLPLWLWSSFAFTVATAGITAWGLTRYWRDDDHE